MDDETKVVFELLQEADATFRVWKVTDDPTETWGIFCPIDHERIHWVASGRKLPTSGEVALMASAPDLARCCIGLKEEVGEVRSECDELRRQLVEMTEERDELRARLEAAGVRTGGD